LSEDRKERPLPVRTLHEFLFEINSEWDRFRTGSLLSIVTTLILFLIFIPRFLLITLRRGGPFDKITIIGIIVALIYNMYLSYRQHNFYRKWEKRMGLLLHMEEEILGGSA
jgi:hypothetical protein